jgi:hypothetical protein
VEAASLTPEQKPCTDRSAGLTDRIQRFFTRPFFLSLTIGIPFCLYKGLFGLAALRAGMAAANPLLTVFGWTVILWAVVDLLMNIWRALTDLDRRVAGIEYCSLAELGRIFHRPAVFLAVDTLISFAIISLMLWSGWIATLTTPEAYLWYAATTLNLISISVASLYNEMKKAEQPLTGP